MANLGHLEVHGASGELRTIIETPRGTRNKYTYNDKLELFELSGVMPLGAVFPFDFGFFPSTLGEDGDPLDVLVLMDEPAYPGCLIPVELIAVLKAQQTSEKEDNRNDRLIAVHTKSRLYEEIREADHLPKAIAHDIEHFFVSYNAHKGVEFKPLGLGGASEAKKLLKEAMERYTKEKR